MSAFAPLPSRRGKLIMSAPKKDQEMATMQTLEVYKS